MSSTLTPSGWVVDKDVVDERKQLQRLTGAQIDTLNAKIAAGSNEWPVGTQVIRVDDGVILTLEGIGSGAAFVPPGLAAVLVELAKPLGSSSVGFIQDESGAVVRTVQSKLRDFVSLTDLGGVGDDATNNNSAVTDAAAAGIPIATPPGTYRTTLASPAITANLRGPGQVKDVNGNKRAPIFTAITAAPAALGGYDSPETAFNGDLRKSPGAEEYRITGAATLGQPATAYRYTPEASPHWLYVYNESGHNQSTSGNDGRTAATAYRTHMFQAGQGDAMCYNGTVFVTGAKPGSTHFLANPAGSLFAGDVQAGANGVYLNPYETFCTDGGFDAACVGNVNNLERTIATGAKAVWWGGYRVQSKGSAAVDNMLSGVGKFIVGLDLAMGALDFGADKAAISLKADDRIYLNNAAAASGGLSDDCRTTTFNNDYISYASSISGILVAVAGVPVAQFGSAQTTLTNDVVLTGANLGFYGASAQAKPTVTGSRGGNAALTSLLTALATLGLITNSTTA